MLYFQYRQLYWTTGSIIYQLSLTELNVKPIFLSTSSKCVFSLAFSENLYWTERCVGETDESVNSLNITTLEDTIIIKNSSVDSYYGVAYFNNTIYWTADAHVYSTPASGGGGEMNEIVFFPENEGTQFRGIVVVDPSLQPDLNNPTSSVITSSISNKPTPSPTQRNISEDNVS